jgi:hypothetical protein
MESIFIIQRREYEYNDNYYANLSSQIFAVMSSPEDGVIMVNDLNRREAEIVLTSSDYHGWKYTFQEFGYDHYNTFIALNSIHDTVYIDIDSDSRESREKVREMIAQDDNAKHSIDMLQRFAVARQMFYSYEFHKVIYPTKGKE